MARRTRRIVAAALAAACFLPAGGCAAGRPHGPTEQPTGTPSSGGERRAIILSLDSFNEARIRSSVPASAIPALTALTTEGTCATSARTAFPSVTAAGHASLWTGTYGDASGITANQVPRLPRDRHTLLDLVSGFLPTQLAAEPLWITAALNGVSTVAHHATQSPGAPGYPPIRVAVADSTSLRRRADSALTSGALHLVNGYNRSVAGPRVVTEATAGTRRVSPWPGLARYAGADGSVAPREAAVQVGDAPDSLFILLTGRDGVYDRALVSPARDASRGVLIQAAPVEREHPRERPLARHFSAPITLTADGRAVRTRVRLFALSRDGTRFLLFLPPIAAIESNHGATRAMYEATTAWVGNSAGSLLVTGRFGPTLGEGGDGTAERRWLETAELMTRESIVAAEHLWSSYEPRLFIDYFALGDDTDHLFWGLAAPDAPGYDPAVARAVQEIRARAWSLVDARVAALQAIARRSGAMLFLVGDHGMRASWQAFRPNVVLARAGLLALDSAGAIDLRRSRAVSPNGYWISVNRTARRDGIVPPDEERAVVDAAVRALHAARDTAGRPIVTQVYLVTGDDSLGIGGPAGGDVYFELARGFAYSADVSGEVAAPTRVLGTHGFPSVSPDMYTVLCAWGTGVSAGRIPQARTIDLAPTVLEWLHVPSAASVRGRSLLATMRR